MNIFRTTKDFILEDNLKIIYFDNKINIVNYKKITGFDSNKIIVDCDTKLVIISGNNLVITKLLLDELLISGEIDKVEFR
ncbi:MAG: hypothetical protein E7170_01590 [Firmicutes bacterium]|nr:hypothetical protein [Bacillota bacterium]